MEAKSITFDRPTHEEVREMFRRVKARIAAKDTEIRAMYDKEKRMTQMP